MAVKPPPAGARFIPVLRGWAGTAIAFWLPAAAGISVLAGVAYTAVQQDLRMGANDPQIQISEDAAARLDQGAPPSAVVGTGYVDIRHSLAAYVIVFNAAGDPVASGAMLDGKVPAPPHGVFDSARSGGEDRFSWEPAAGVRSAAVLTPFNGGFVLAGRSLREVESRESTIAGVIGLGWVIAVGVAAAAAVLVGLLWAGLGGRSGDRRSGLP